MRDLRLTLTYGTLVLSLAFGWLHIFAWLAMPPLAFGVYMLLDHRFVAAHIGRAAWASHGFARFQIGTNLGLLVQNAIVNAAIFAIAAWTSSLFGG